jgi:hypothetical protein
MLGLVPLGQVEGVCLSLLTRCLGICRVDGPQWVRSFCDQLATRSVVSTALSRIGTPSSIW